MLGKLVKHDFLSTWKVPVALDAVLIFLGILTAFAVQGIHSVGDSVGMSIFMFSFVGVFYIGIIAANIITLIYLVVRYYRNLYTSEGYLTFTLPVKTDMIVHSKVITGSVWMFLSYLFTVVSLLIAGAGFIKATNVTPAELKESFTQINAVMGLTDPGFIAIMIFVFLITPISGILCMYFSVSIGQLWQNHKVLGSVLCIVALYIINQFISQIAFIGSGFWQMMGSPDVDAIFGRIYRNMMLIISIITALEGVAYYIVCLVINRKCVNLD